MPVSAPEHEFLIEMLECMQKSLMEEWVHTEDADYHEYVKERVQTTATLLQKFKAGHALTFVPGQEVPA